MKRNLGNYAIIALVILNIVVWLVFPPVNDGEPNFWRRYVGEIIGSNNIVLMACSLFLSTRPKWAEQYFGGLDKMYMTHRHTGTAAFLLIFAHVLTVPITTTGWRLGNYLAVIAFTGIVTIVLITLAPRIPFLNRLTGTADERHLAQVQEEIVHRSFVDFLRLVDHFHIIRCINISLDAHHCHRLTRLVDGYFYLHGSSTFTNGN